jgi:hypothetical protein
MGRMMQLNSQLKVINMKKETVVHWKCLESKNYWSHWMCFYFTLLYFLFQYTVLNQ